jgi:plastocyanin
MKKSLIAIGSALILIAGCTAQSTQTTATPTPTSSAVTTDTPAPTQVTGDTNSQTVSMTIDEESFSFTPKVLNVKAGQTIHLTLTSTSGGHNFVVDDLGVTTTTLSAGTPQTVDFAIPADAAGKTYEFHCSVANHKDLGMTGQIKVS